jgi:hypothetical protein
MAKRETDQVSPKTSEEALDFVRKMQKAFPKTPRGRKDQAALRKYLAQFTDAELRAVGRRLLSDLMQGPRTAREGDLPPTPAAPYPAPPTSGPKPKAARVRTRTPAVAKSRKARRRRR